jgi:ankyrin repeat protein
MDDEEFNLLLWQAKFGATATVLEAVDLDPALATRCNEFGQRLLHNACHSGELELATGLLDRGSDVHARDIGGYDAMLWASGKGHLPVVTILLDRGADPCTRGNHWTALGAATAWGHHPVCPEGRTWRRR